MPKTILTCAVTGGGDTVGRNPAVPVTPQQIADSALDAAKAGAAIVHIHVRDPETGKPSMRFDLYREVVDRIRQADVGVLINLTTGPGGFFVPGDPDPQIAAAGSTLSSPQKRVAHVVELRPEICSLDCGTMNFYDRPYIASPPHLKEMAKLIAAAGVKPELEVFDSGHVRLARHLVDEGLVGSPPLFQIVLGVPWNSPATGEAMTFLKGLLPSNAVWAAFGVSAAAIPMIAQSWLLGGQVRVGLEDTLYLDRGVLAPSNAALVERAARVISALGGELASPSEARQILHLN